MKQTIWEVIYLVTCSNFFKFPQIKITIFILLNKALLIKGHYIYLKTLRALDKKISNFNVISVEC